jgi:hypothetical protein
MKSRLAILLVAALATIAALVGCSASGKITVTQMENVAVYASVGTPQSAAVGAAFTTQLAATVTTNGTPTSGVTVTFSAPASGASGTFAGGVNTATTNSSGVATAPVFTANTTAGSYTVTASVAGTPNSASFSLTNTAGAAATVTATAGTPQSAVVGAQFTTALQVTVVDSDSNPVNGAAVTFTAPATGASGTFAATTPSTTVTASTNSSGVAVAPAFTANAIAGAYTVTAAVSGVSAAADFSLTNTVATTAAPLNPGNYAFWLAGEDSYGGPYYVAGAFAVNASGAITGGEQDFIDSAPIIANDQLNGNGCTAGGSCITQTADGNLQITLTTCSGTNCAGTDSNIGVNGVETLNATLTSLPTSATSNARIIELDSWATGSGQLEPQTVPTATPQSGYAFSVGGWDSGGYQLGIGGVIDVDSAGGISGTGSVFDDNDGGLASALTDEGFAQSFVSAAPLDAFGRVIFTLNPSAASTVPQIVLVGYFVDSIHMRLLETSDSLGGITGGQALVQTGTGSFNNASFEGTSYVFGAVGADSNNGGSALQLAGVVTGNVVGTTTSVSGNISFNDLSNVSGSGGVAITGGTYQVDSTGRVSLTGLNVGTFTYNLELYLDGNGNARVLSVDTNDIVDGVSGLQKGTLSASSFSGTYALGATGIDPTFLAEFDAVGPVVADGVGNFPGFVDLNWIGATNPGPTFTNEPVTPATFAATSTPGIFTGNITGLDVTDCQVYESATNTCTADAFTYYLVSSSTVVGIESDANQQTLIRFELQQ